MSVLDSIKSSANSAYDFLLGSKSGVNPNVTNSSSAITDPSNDFGEYSIKIVIQRAKKNNQKDKSGNTVSEVKYVIARLSEDFKIGVSSEWSSLTSGSNGGLGTLLDIGARSIFGSSLKTQILTAQTWTGNSPIQFTLPIRLRAFKNANKEVKVPMLDLMKAVLPTVGKFNFLIPPGPNIMASAFGKIVSTIPKESLNIALNIRAATANSGYTELDKSTANNEIWSSFEKIGNSFSNSGIDKGVGISLMIGKFFFAKNLIITNVDCDLKSIMSNDKNPTPMSVDCNITFRTIFAPTSDDINSWFFGLNN